MKPNPSRTKLNEYPHSPALLSVVVPVYNEEDVLLAFHQRLAAVLDSLDTRSEVIYINDGSKDNTMVLLQGLRSQDKRVAIIDLSRNFGKEIAMTAGLDHTSGDAVVVIDADLQDPPELIRDFIKQWRKGYDVVYGQRNRRVGESVVKRLTAYLFYRVMKRLSRVEIPSDTGDFRLMSRRAVDALSQLREHHRFMKGLFAWVGFPQVAVHYRRDSRYAGNTKWNYWRLWNFALEGITSFSAAPLKIATYVGVFTALAAFIYGWIIIARTLLFGSPVPGYPSLMVVMLFLGGIQLMAIGIVGEYLARMFDETKNRPLYLLNSYTPAEPTDVSGPLPQLGTNS